MANWVSEKPVKQTKQELWVSETGTISNCSPKLTNKIGFDTLSTDMSTLGKTVEGIYKGWQSKKTMDSTKPQVESMYNRLKAFQSYNKQFGDGSVDVSEQLNAYKTILDEWDDITNGYGKYKNADEYNKAVKSQVNYDTYNFEAEKENTRLLENDLTAVKNVKRQISNLENDIRVLKFSGSRGSTKNAAQQIKEKEKKIALLNSSLEKTWSKYGNEDKLKALIAERKSVYKSAERYQSLQKLLDVVNPESQNYDKNFNKYVESGKKIAEDEYNGLNVYYGDYRDAYNALARRQKGESLSRLNGGIYDKSFEDNEWDLLAYYIGKDKATGKNQAREFLDLMEETLNQREGNEIYEKYLKDNTFLEVLYGVPVGLDQFSNGIKNLLNTKDDYIPASSVQMAGQYVREDLADDGFKLPDWLGEASIAQIGYDTLSTTANMAPSILISLIPGVGQTAGAVVMGASAAGNAYQQALNNGMDKGQARVYSTLVGASEAVLSRTVSKVFGGKILSNKITTAIEGIEKSYLRFAANYTWAFVSEGAEEGLQEILTPLFENIALGYNKNGFEDIDWSEVAYSFLLGGLSGGNFELVGSGIKRISNVATVKQNYNTPQKVKNLLALGLSAPADSKVNSLAKKYNTEIANKGKLSANKLYNLAVASENFVSDRLSQLGEKNNISEVASAVVKKLTGVELSTTEIELLSKSDYGQDVLKTVVPKGEVIDTENSLQNGDDSAVVEDAYNADLSESEQRLVNTPDSKLTPEQRAVKQNILERQQKNITQNGDVDSGNVANLSERKSRSKSEKANTLRKSYERERNIVSAMSSERQQYLKEKHSEYDNILKQLEIGDKLISAEGDIIGEVVAVQDGNISIVGEEFSEIILNDSFTDDGIISFLETGGSFDISIKKQINANLEKLNNMRIVASLDLETYPTDKHSIMEWILNRLSELKSNITRIGFGEIVFDKKRIKNGFAYKKTNSENIAVLLVPQVLENGVDIYKHPNHKERGYGTTTFAAPIEINGHRGNMAVVVRQEGENYYKVHRVLTPDGSQFNFYEKRDTAETAGQVQNKLDVSPTNNISKDSIPDLKEKVNKFRENSDTDYELSDNDQYAKDKSFWTAENKNDTTVSKSLKDKLANLFSKKNDKKTVSISEIVKQIEKEFNVPVSKGKFREKAYGIYKNHSQAIRTKISNALPTIAHELGHHLDNKYGLRYFESIGEAERTLKETRPDFYNAYKPEARPREAVAEFIRDYLADRKMAKDKYPFFFEEFERRLSENGKTDLENLKKIGDKINEYYTAELRERAKASIITRKEAKKINRIGIKLGDILTRAETEMLDDGAAFKKISQKAYDLYYWAKKSSVRAKNTLTGYYMAGFKDDLVKQRDKDGNIMKDENGKEIYVPALKFILSDIETNEMFDDFNEYLVLRHGIEWLNQDFRVFADDALNNKKYMTDTISDFEKQYPQFKEISEKLYEWYRTFVYEYGVNSGLMTKEQYKTLVEKYPCYVPFMRNVEGQKKGFAKSGMANQNAPIKRAKGSGLEIYHPIESLVIKVEQFMKAADRNAVMQEIANTVDAEDGFGWLLEEVPPDMIPNTISSQVIKDAAKKSLREGGIDDSVADDFSNLIDELIGESITDFKIGYIQGENVVAVRRNGKRTLYQVHDENMLTALTGLRPEQFGIITRGIGKATRLFKALTTGSNAVWSIVSNAPRDFDSAYKYGSENNPIKYTVDYIKAVASQFGKQDSETMKLYRTLGGGYNNSFSNARELQLTAKELFNQDKNFADRIKSLFHIVENVTKLADFVETAPRLAEFKRVYERTNDAKKAMLAAEEVTVNFNRSGKFAKTLDQYLPYFNASLQGNAKYAKAIAHSFSKEGDKSFLVKSIVTGIIKTGIMFGILGLFGDEGEEEYEKLSAYKKNNFYNIYIGGGKFISIPKSQATGVFDSLLERVFEVARKEDVEWGQEIKDFAGYMWLTFGPPLVDDIIIGSTVLDLAKNEDFTGAPIVSSYYEDLEPEMQYNEKTTYIAKSIGQLFGWSPMKIDHIIESNLGVFGLINKSLGRAEKDWTLGTKTKVVTDSAYSTDILNNFYDEAEDYASKAKSYPDNAEYVYKDKQYTAIKSIVSAFNGYGKDDPELAREFKILARDYVDKFEKASTVNKKLLDLLEKTGNDDILYDRTFKPTYSINKVEYKMEFEEFMELIDKYYEDVEKEYEEVFGMNLSDESTEKMLIDAKERVYKQVAAKYKIKR